MVFTQIIFKIATIHITTNENEAPHMHTFACVTKLRTPSVSYGRSGSFAAINVVSFPHIPSVQSRCLLCFPVQFVMSSVALTSPLTGWGGGGLFCLISPIFAFSSTPFPPCQHLLIVAYHVLILHEVESRGCLQMLQSLG